MWDDKGKAKEKAAVDPGLQGSFYTKVCHLSHDQVHEEMQDMQAAANLGLTPAPHYSARHRLLFEHLLIQGSTSTVYYTPCKSCCHSLACTLACLTCGQADHHLSSQLSALHSPLPPPPPPPSSSQPLKFTVAKFSTPSDNCVFHCFCSTSWIQLHDGANDCSGGV